MVENRGPSPVREAVPTSSSPEVSTLGKASCPAAWRSPRALAAQRTTATSPQWTPSRAKAEVTVPSSHGHGASGYLATGGSQGLGGEQGPRPRGSLRELRRAGDPAASSSCRSSLWGSASARASPSPLGPPFIGRAPPCLHIADEKSEPGRRRGTRVPPAEPMAGSGPQRSGASSRAPAVGGNPPRRDPAAGARRSRKPRQPDASRDLGAGPPPPRLRSGPRV